MTDENEKPNTTDVTQIPLLPLRDILVFPSTVVPLFVGREKSIQALEQAMSGNKQILLAAQIKAKTNDPSADDIYDVGTTKKTIEAIGDGDDGPTGLGIDGSGCIGGHEDRSAGT